LVAALDDPLSKRGADHLAHAIVGANCRIDSARNRVERSRALIAVSRKDG
jgi:hypothetical protein